MKGYKQSLNKRANSIQFLGERLGYFEAIVEGSEFSSGNKEKGHYKWGGKKYPTGWNFFPVHE
jgi:hypothetical protein